jgi:hypothetical protein
MTGHSVKQVMGPNDFCAKQSPEHSVRLFALLRTCGNLLFSTASGSATALFRTHSSGDAWEPAIGFECAYIIQR